MTNQNITLTQQTPTTAPTIGISEKVTKTENLRGEFTAASKIQDTLSLSNEST